MSANDSVIELLDEVCAPLGAFKARRMFGGHGLYLDGVFFAILDDGVLYFKTSEDTRERFEAEGMSAFTYESKSGTHALVSYWRVPERLFDEADELADWVSQAVKAARTKPSATRRAAAPKRKPRA
ncbi:MAG: TfoX/Sxy family protein [Hyphomicrobiaceae bacterium]